MRNKYLVIVIRVLLGLIFLGSGVSGIMMAMSSSMQGVPPNLVVVMQSLLASGIFGIIKMTEVVAGLMLITGFLPALAAIFVAPICVGVVVIDALLSPNFLFLGIIISLFDAYLGYAYWDKYRALFTR